MPRRHKYRAYLRDAGEMAEVSDLVMYDDEDRAASGNHGEVFVRGYRVNSFYFPEEADLMQWSGLVDKNGLEIYERDVCQVKGGWSGDQVQLMYDLDNFHFWDEVMQNLEAGATYTVMGNICENPELVESA